MSEAIRAGNGTSPALHDNGEAYRWIRCVGCDGEVGIPSDWTESSVACPECGRVVQAKGRVLYRPDARADARTPQGPAPAAPTRGPSLHLTRQADLVMACGFLSIVLGWTVVVPLFGTLVYSHAWEQAKKEEVPVPGKATLGLVLSLLFGAVQALALIAHFNK